MFGLGSAFCISLYPIPYTLYPMKHHRPERMGQLIRDEISNMILRELEFDKSLVTVTYVEVSKDLEHAKVKVSVIPEGDENAVIKVLKKFRKHFQFELIRKLNLRPLPEIDFAIDHGLERAAIIEKDLLDIAKKEG